MKRKPIIFAVALLVALLVTVGTYAYTFPTSTMTTAANTAGGGIISSISANSSVNWQSLLPHSENGVEYLRPMGPGDVTNLSGQFPNYGAHWQKVLEVTPDEFSSTVYGTVTSYKTDLYALWDHSQGTGTVNSVTVYFRFTGTGSSTAYAMGIISAGGTVYAGPEETQAGSIFVTKSYTWGSNPYTSQAWTWSDIDALQAGIMVRRSGNGEATVTQVYVVVDYTTDPITKGDVPTGNLFRITPHPAYTGDLQVRVYLTNISALLKAYRYLNMKVYIPGSLEASQTPNYQLLNLDNGLAVFNIPGAASSNYTVDIVGGSYILTSGYTTGWGTGWSITPEVYCEATQR